jgi:hypothetical protein
MAITPILHDLAPRSLGLFFDRLTMPYPAGRGNPTQAHNLCAETDVQRIFDITGVGSVLSIDAVPIE